MKQIFLIVLIILPGFLFSQNSDSTKTSPLAIWGFVDIYYAYDFNNPKNHNRPKFIYSHNRHNEFQLNNGIFGVKYSKNIVRSAFALHTGSYVRVNYAAEPNLFRFIYEANAGVEIIKNVWVDAGIFSSHIGFESAISIDNFTLSRSIMADNTPYYETGVKFTFQPNDKLTLTGLVLNGWQNIVENNDNKAFGTQIQFKPAKNLLLNSSTFFGKETASYDSLASMRYFHNFYAQIHLSKISIFTAFDIGLQKIRNGSGSNIWYNPNFIVRYKPSDKFSMAGRVEYYNDEKGVIVFYNSPNGFQTLSTSLNFDYWFTSSSVWRIEGRLFHSKNKIFLKENDVNNNNDVFVLTSLSVKF